MGASVDLLTDQKEYDESKNSGDKEFTEETEGAKFPILHLVPTQKLFKEANANRMSQEVKRKDNAAPTKKGITRSKEKLNREETRNEEEIDTATKCIVEEMKEAECIIGKVIQEIQEIHLYTPNVHQINSSCE